MASSSHSKKSSVLNLDSFELDLSTLEAPMELLPLEHFNTCSQATEPEIDIYDMLSIECDSRSQSSDVETSDSISYKAESQESPNSVNITEIHRNSIKTNELGDNILSHQDRQSLNTPLQGIPISVCEINLVNNIPCVITYALNNNNKKVIDSFFCNIIAHDCEVGIAHPSASGESRGALLGIELLKAVTNHSDFHLSITKNEIRKCGNIIKVILHGRFKGIVNETSQFYEFLGLKDGTLMSDFMFDPKKTSAKDIEKQRALEERTIKAGKRVQVFSKGVMVIEYDTIKKKITREWAYTRLSSLRPEL